MVTSIMVYISIQLNTVQATIYYGNLMYCININNITYWPSGCISWRLKCNVCSICTIVMFCSFIYKVGIYPSNVREI